MWKAFFLAVGICLCILGAECLVIERVYLKPKAAAAGETPVATSLLEQAQAPGVGVPREVIPPEWAPWSLMAAGAVVVLYSITLPKRIGG